MDLGAFAKEVGGVDDGPVTIAGASTRGGPVPRVRTVRAPGGIDWIQADEMIVSCGAGTLVDDLEAALADAGQRIALPSGGTVGGALAVGRSGIRRLGDGPIRDVLLEAHYVSAAGDIVKAGGPTVKNVSGFDLCRLLVGSRGTLGFLGSLILRTRPLAMASQWFRTDTEPSTVVSALYRPVSVLWDGATTWALLEGHPDDVSGQAAAAGLQATDRPPPLPDGGRWSISPSAIRTLAGTGSFVAEVGVGVVHHAEPAPPRKAQPAVISLHHRLKQQFDPKGRLNPGVSVLDV